MSNLKAFSNSTVEALKYYVYALVDVSTNRICYIGKGKNQRVFESLKAKTNDLNKPLDAYIIRHTLTEHEAFSLEAALIDFFPYFALSDLLFNRQDGIDNKEIGIASVDDIENHYAAPIITNKDFKHNVLIISINRSAGSHNTLLTPVGLYECTRRAWNINLEKAKKVDFVIAKQNGLLKEIYKPHEWHLCPSEPNKNRYEFIGDIVMDSNIRELYLNKRLDKRSYGNPLTYIINNELT